MVVWTPFLCALVFVVMPVRAETITVRHLEGMTHGFLVLYNDQREAIAYGDLSQDTDKGLVTAELTFRFKNGSLYDDTTVFSQHRVFRVLSDHLVEKGPSFKEPMETWINATTGEFKARAIDKPQERLVSKRIKIPADLANGIIYILAKNLDPKSTSTTVSLLVGSTKPRIVKLVIGPHREQKFAIGDLQKTATHYVIKFNLGGTASVIAPVIGKQPANMDIWVSSDGIPAVLMSRGQLFEGGPIWTIALTAPHWSLNGPSD